MTWEEWGFGVTDTSGLTNTANVNDSPLTFVRLKRGSGVEQSQPQLNSGHVFRWWENEKERLDGIDAAIGFRKVVCAR